MILSRSLKSTVLIAAAAVVCAGVQLEGVASLAGRQPALAALSAEQLPTSAATTTATIQRLPQVVVIGRRSAADTATAQAAAAARASAI